VKNSILTVSPAVFEAHNAASKQSALLFSVSSTGDSNLNFDGYENSIFKNNLSYSDASFTQLLPEIALILYREKSPLSNEGLCERLIKTNILRIDNHSHAHIYQHKIKHFLKAVLQGLNPLTVWHADEHDAHHFSLAKTVSGEAFLFHSSEFLKYLFTHTHLSVESSETIGAQRLINGTLSLKLNLQIRFFH
jgi:HpaII restriction endonuclease